MYSAYEELAFPQSSAFIEHFVMTGFHVLSRSVFLQYLSKNIFVLTHRTMAELLRSLTDSKEDNSFRYQLLLKLKDKKKEMQILETLPENHPFLVDYYHSLLHQTPTTTEQLSADAENLLTLYMSMSEDDAHTLEQTFTPLAYFLLSLRVKDRDAYRVQNNTMTSLGRDNERRFIEAHAKGVLSQFTPFSKN